MKFKLLSDLHLEFYKDDVWTPKQAEDDKNTVLLLAGDIHVGKKALPWIEDRCEQYKEVVYILGNHEFYNQEYHKTIDFWQNTFQGGNFTFLHNDYFANYDDGYRIFGATLWTDVTDAFNVWHGRRQMADYGLIKINERHSGYYRKINVQDTNNFHLETVQKLQQWLQTPWKGKTIVMTHHLPHPLCVANRFKNDKLTDFFMTNLDNIIERFDIDYWVHGHTHDNVDAEVHGTKILCNPMGYHGIQLNQEFNEGLVFEC